MATDWRLGTPQRKLRVPLSGRVDRKVLKWFWYVERMGSERMTKRVYMSEVEGQRGRGRPPFRWKDGVRRACAEREMGLEEARGLCLDRDAWRGVTDRIVWLIKCGQRQAFDAVRRGIGHLRWDSAGNSGVLSGVLGVTRPHDDRNIIFGWTEKHVWLHLSWSTKECLSGCDEWMWVWMDFFGFSFLLCGYPMERGGCHLLVAVKARYMKKQEHNVHIRMRPVVLVWILFCRYWLLLSFETLFVGISREMKEEMGFLFIFNINYYKTLFSKFQSPISEKLNWNSKFRLERF